MRWSDVIHLIPTTQTKNSIGSQIEVEGKPRQVFANKKSIKLSEFYQAAVTGLKPEIMFEVWSFDYNGEKKLSFGTKKYTIIRTYEKGEITELICSA